MSTTVRSPTLWALREAVVPLMLVIAVVWLAGSSVTVRWNADWQQDWFGTPPPTASSAALAMPVRGVSPDALTDSYTDPRSGGRTHHAIDIFAPAGTHVVAAAPGTVVQVSDDGLGGNAVYVRTPDGAYVHYYAHLFRIGPGVEKGSTVDTGDVLGYVGTSGNARSYHLHFAVWKQTDESPPWADKPVNPYPLLTQPAGS